MTMEGKENDQINHKKRTRRAAFGDFVTNEQYDALIEKSSIAIHKAVDAPWSRMLSAYTAQHVFIKCPACGKTYAISDPDLGRSELLDCYQQRLGKECWIQCDQIYPSETAEMIQAVTREKQPSCTCRFTLHEGLVEYKALEPITWFSRGPYMHTAADVATLRIGQAIRPKLPVEFSWIDYVDLRPGKTKSGEYVKAHWYRTGPNMNEFIVLTSSEDESDIGEPTTVSWTAVGSRKLPEGQGIEPWRRFLISSARTLLYGHDPRMSILESFMAFELFLDEFLEDRWQKPHLKSNLDYFDSITSFSTLAKVRILLHEALAVHFVESKEWGNWDKARAFRNQVAHGKRLEETMYKKKNDKKKKNIGSQFKDSTEIAKFCYESIVRAIYFIRYWT
jgi:hypothetical protein